MPFGAAADEVLLAPDDDAQVMRTGGDTRVVDAMHRGVIACEAASSALTLARVMAAHRIHCVVVKTADAPRLVTDGELAAALYDGQLERRTAEELSRPAPLLRLDDTLAFALARMHEDGVTHAIVVTPSFGLLGVVSVIDLVERMLGTVP